MDPLQPFGIGPWRADPRLAVISRADSSVRLVPKSMELLCYLARRAGVVVSSEEIEKSVWPNVIVTPSSVYQAIADLRRALGDDKHQPAFIETVPRKGYRLIAAVVWEGPVARRATDVTHTSANATPVRADAPADVPVATPVDAPAPAVIVARGRRRPNVTMVAGLAALTTALGALAFLLWRSSPVTVAANEPRSIAVLPVADFSEDSSQGHFADGLTDEMLNTLSQIPGLRVTARTSVFAFKDRGADVRAIGKALGTRYVLEGSVRRGNGRVRVTAQLIDAYNGYHIWSKTYDRPLNDVLDVQEEIARAVAASLQVTLNGEALSRIAGRRTPNVDAYDLYLLGRHYQLLRNPGGTAKAIEYQQQAIASDPGFALAYAGLADAHMGTFYYSNRPLNDVRDAMVPLLAKGLELNPKLPELYAARALLRTQQFDLANAEQDLKRAIELNPSYAEAYVRLGAAYEYDGRPGEALEAFAHAATLDPLHFTLHVRRCLALQNLGRYAEATAACNRALELDAKLPNAYWARGLIALSSGNYDAAIAGYRDAIARAPQRVDLLGQLAWLYLDVGLPQRAAAQFKNGVAVTGAGLNYGYLSEGRYFIATNDMPELRRRLALPSLEGAADTDLQLDMALLELVSGNSVAARRYCDRATQASDFNYRPLFDVWQTRWGMSDVLTLAQCARASNHESDAKRYLADLSDYLDRLERNGQVWHGLRYLRADVRALQGMPREAMVELEAATRLGWRRSWWPRHDPSLASLRGTAPFERWLNSLDASNEVVRVRMQSAEVPALASKNTAPLR